MAVAVEQMQRLGQRRHRARTDPICCHFLGVASDLRAFLRRHTRCPADAEDLTQEIFLRIWRNDSAAEIRRFDALAYKIARNLLRDRSRRGYTRLARHSTPLGELEMPDLTEEPCSQVEALQTLVALSDSLRTLRPASRRAFWLYRVDSWSHARIAAAMGISVSMVEKHVSYAMSALRRDGFGGSVT
jgi:RNA polymerase sigma factor (sigma-70 family)